MFMPGGYEIRRTLEAIGNLPESKGYILLPLYGELPPAEQDAAVSTYDQPKVVVATNVAETSITIDGVRLVIDSGLARIPALRSPPRHQLAAGRKDQLVQLPINGPGGPAGRRRDDRSASGPSPSTAERARADQPEVRRLDLAELVLTLKAASVGDLHHFRWLESPHDAALDHGGE